MWIAWCLRVEYVKHGKKIKSGFFASAMEAAVEYTRLRTFQDRELQTRLKGYTPSAVFSVITKPPSAIEPGSYIAHRWDITPDFPRGWYEGRVVEKATTKRFSGQYAVKYEGFTPSTYYHTLSLDACGVDKVWVAINKQAK